MSLPLFLVLSAVSSLSLPSFAVVKPFTSGTFRFELSLMKLKVRATSSPLTHCASQRWGLAL